MSAIRRWQVVSSLGIVQILAWGSSYYLMAVLAQPIVNDTGWPLPWVVGALSLGLVCAGLASPLVGRWIARHGGRPVLAAGCTLLTAGLLICAVAPGLPALAAGSGAGSGALVTAAVSASATLPSSLAWWAVPSSRSGR